MYVLVTIKQPTAYAIPTTEAPLFSHHPSIPSPPSLSPSLPLSLKIYICRVRKNTYL